MATWLDAATCRRIEENVAQQLPSRTSQLPTPECFLSTNSVIMHHGQAYFFAITSTFHCNFAEWSNDWDLEGSCSLSCIQAIARHNCATEALSETNCLCVVLPRGPQGTGPRCANFWISTWCESPHWWIYYINGKRDPEREGTHKGVKQYRSTECQVVSVGISGCPAPTWGQWLEHLSQEWKSVGCTSHSWDCSSASMCIRRDCQAGGALLAVFCRMLHLSSIFCAKHLHDGTWDVKIPKYPPDPRKLMKCIWNGRILMWSINPLLCRTLISLYK